MAYTQHKVKSGETLDWIANRYNVDASEIQSLNNLTGNNVSGMTLSIPPSNKNSSYYKGTSAGYGYGQSKAPNATGTKTSSSKASVGSSPAGNMSGLQTMLPSYSAPSAGYDPNSNAAYTAAISALNSALAQTPTYAGTYDAQLNTIYNQIMNRDPFTFDLNSDILYNQYKDQYMRLGEMAMMDTMGQAAALTGGYGSTYSQAVGQQQYNAYLQQLNEVVPDIYNMAYDRYTQEGQDLQNRYAVTSDMQQGEYNRYLNDLNQYWNNVNYFSGRADAAYSQGQSEYWNNLNYTASREDEMWNRAMQMAKQSGSGGSSSGGSGSKSSGKSLSQTNYDKALSNYESGKLETYLDSLERQGYTDDQLRDLIDYAYTNGVNKVQLGIDRTTNALYSLASGIVGAFR